MEWQPMATAPKDGARVHARDVDGNEQVTWFCDGDWVYAGWRETEDRDEYETEGGGSRPNGCHAKRGLTPGVLGAEGGRMDDGLGRDLQPTGKRRV